MRRAKVLFCALCASLPSVVFGQSYVFDQLGPPDGSAIPNQGFVFGYFHHYSTPPISFGNRACLDDFILDARTRITSIEVLLCGAPGAPINWPVVPSWRVEFYSSPQVALNNDLRGDLLHQVMTAPTHITVPYTPLNYAGQSLALIQADVDVTLDAGMYWATILPNNSTSNGYGVQIGSNIGNAFATWQVLPGQTVIPLGHPGLAIRIKGEVVGAACYPDCNGDGALNLADFGCFQTKFALGEAYADCNGDGVRDLADFGCFTTKFAIGCP